MPNRILKESITTSEDIERLDWQTEVFFYRLLVCCDDYGRMDARPSILRARCFPLRMAHVSERQITMMLDRLEQAGETCPLCGKPIGLIRLYEVAGRCYLQVTKWDAHQQVRAKRSKYPAMITDDSICNHMLAYVPENPNPNPNPNPNRESESAAQTAAAVKAYENTIGLISGAQQREEIIQAIGELSAVGHLDWWAIALKEAADHNARSWAYVRRIVERCLSTGQPPGTKPNRRNGRQQDAPQTADELHARYVPKDYEDVIEH